MYTSVDPTKRGFKAEKGAKNQKLSKKKKDFENARPKILEHLDLTKPLHKNTGGKLYSNLEMCRQAKDRIGEIKKRGQKDSTELVPSMKELLLMKEN